MCAQSLDFLKNLGERFRSPIFLTHTLTGKQMKNFLNKAKSFLETDTGKVVLGVVAMIIAGVITSKIVNKSEE